MKKFLPGLSLLSLLILASGQGSKARALTGQFPSEPEKAIATNPEVAEISLTSPSPERSISPTPLLPHSESPPPATTVTEWIAQIEASLVQITNVRLEATAAGLQVILETADGELAEPTTTVSGNALIAVLSNAVLALAEGDEFQQFGPAENIALVQVTGLSGDRVQVVITGADAPPTVDISSAITGLTLSATPGKPTAQTSDDETIQILVTGEEGSRYVEPNTSTATRTDTPLRDIPQSIQVIPREVLEDQQVIRLNDALRNVSGVVSTSRASIRGQRFAIRGFEDSSILRDGFRLTAAGSNFGFPELTNLETVEVLKGPASILAGSIEPGGVVNLVSKQPLSEPFYALELQSGNRELLSPSLDFSGPLTDDDRLLYRLNALVRNENSFRNYDTDIRRSFIAPTLSWQISDRTDLTISLEYIDIEQPADNGLVAIDDEVADIPFDRVIGELDDINQDERLRAAYQFEHRFNDLWKLRNSFSYSRIDSSVSVNSFDSRALNEATGDGFLIPVSDSSIRETFDLQTNVVGEFNTGSVEHTVLFGVDLFRSDFRDRELRFGLFSPVPFNIFDPIYGTVPRPDEEDIPLLASSDTQIDGLGIYLQDQVALLDNLKLLAGVRYETVDQKVTNNPTDLNPNSSDSTLNEDAFTPRVGLVYQPIEELSLYGSYTTSFVPNTATTFNGDLLEPERGEQFEIGARADLLAGRLTANLALFNLTKENVATTDPDNIFFSVATGEQRSRGIELDIAGEILPGWNIIANYAYIDAEIKEDEDGNEGNRLRNIPEHTFNLWTTYDIQAGPLEGLGFGLGVNYVSERFGDNANSFTAEDYFLTNAAVSYQRDNWRAALNIRNLFDVDYIEAAGTSRTSGIDPGEPFTLIGSFAIEF
ncbi:MAG: TonB-dependent receptor [Cyanobacteria bacterium P01_C01_bin.70]